MQLKPNTSTQPQPQYEPECVAAIKAERRKGRSGNMMIDEFERLTGFYPSAEMYEAIEQEYTESRADKYEFCKLYKANEDGVAEKIARKATTMWAKRVGEALLENEALKGKIKQLEADLEQEREWRLFEDKRTTKF